MTITKNKLEIRLKFFFNFTVKYVYNKGTKTEMMNEIVRMISWNDFLSDVVSQQFI